MTAETRSDAIPAASAPRPKEDASPRPCERCGASFVPTRPKWQRYCSDRCRAAAYKAKVEVPQLAHEVADLKRRVAAPEAAAEGRGLCS